MILKNNLYTILQKEGKEQNYRFTIRLNPEHVIFQAHFPEEPVTPGVCIVQIAKELLEDTYGLKLELTGIKNVKFLSIINPVATPVVQYSFEKVLQSAQDNKLKAQVVVSSGENVLAKISFTCHIHV